MAVVAAGEPTQARRPTGSRMGHEGRSAGERLRAGAAARGGVTHPNMDSRRGYGLFDPLLTGQGKAGAGGGEDRRVWGVCRGVDC